MEFLQSLHASFRKGSALPPVRMLEAGKPCRYRETSPKLALADGRGSHPCKLATRPRGACQSGFGRGARTESPLGQEVGRAANFLAARVPAATQPDARGVLRALLLCVARHPSPRASDEALSLLSQLRHKRSLESRTAVSDRAIATRDPGLAIGSF